MNQARPRRRTKVLFLITKAVFGGAQRYVFDLATHLPQNEFETGVAYGVRGRLAEMLETRAIPALEITALGRDIALTADIRSLLSIRRALKASRPDILHVNSSKAALLGAIAGRLVRIRKIVFTAHGWPFKEPRNLLIRAVWYLASYATALLATDVIVVSREDEHIAHKMPGVGKKTRRIPIGREHLKVAPPEEGFRAMCGTLAPPSLTPETIRLVSIAELTANKGIRYGIECVAELQRRGVDAIYVIAGDGEERTALESHAQSCGVADRVFFPGFIIDAARYLSGFDVYLLPSVKEGMPYVLIEAAMAGVPVAATNVIDEEFFVRIPHAESVPPRDPQALADAVVTLAALPRSTPGENPFPLSEMVGETLEVYRS